MLIKGCIDRVYFEFLLFIRMFGFKKLFVKWINEWVYENKNILIFLKKKGLRCMFAW